MSDARDLPSRFDRSIVEGPISRAVWKLAWPTMLQNMIGGLQGIIDHVMVGHFVGYTGNAAVGVAWQIFLVVVVFITSLYTGMGVLVARFAGAGDAEKVNRTVYQAFLTSVVLSLGVLAPLGYVLSPWLLDLVNATPAVKAEALPYLRIMFLFSFGMMTFFMMSGALRARRRRPHSAAPRRRPHRAQHRAERDPHPRARAHPAPRHGGGGLGTVLAGGSSGRGHARRPLPRPMGRGLPPGHGLEARYGHHPLLFRFGLPTGVQGVAMNVAGVMLIRFIGSLEQSAEAQAAYAVGYIELFSLITWSSVGLMGATAAVAGQNLAPAGRIARRERRGRRRRWAWRWPPGSGSSSSPRRGSCSAPSAWWIPWRSDRDAPARVPERFRPVRHGGSQLHGRAPGDGRHAEPALHLARLADRGPARPVRGAGERARPPANGRLARHRAGARDPLRAERRPIPTGEMAVDRGERRPGDGHLVTAQGADVNYGAASLIRRG